MQTISVPQIGKIAPTGKGRKPPVESNGQIVYEVDDEMKNYWENLSEREKETLWNMSLKRHVDLRDVLAEEMSQ